MLNQHRERAEALVSELWENQDNVPEVLTQRITENRARIPRFEFDLLLGIAGSGADEYLERIADNSGAPDITRWGARRRLGWPERGEKARRVEFLESLQDPNGTLIAAIDQGTAELPDGEILGEVLAYLTALPSERRRAILTEAVRELAEQSVWLLHAALHIKDAQTQRLAMEELARLRNPASAGPLERLAKTARLAKVRRDAAEAARTVTAGLREAPDAMQLPPVDRALVTTLDGDGGQAIIVVRSLAPGTFMLADFFHNEGWGIKDSFGFSLAPADRVEDIIESFGEEIELVEVDISAVRGALARAIETNAATGHTLPPAFELWEPFVHDYYPPPPDEPVLAPELDDAPYAGRADLLKGSGRLAEHPFFMVWRFDYRETAVAMMAAPPPNGGNLTEKQYGPMIRQLLTAEVRDRLRRRLRRQAWLLEHAGQTKERDLALAAAAALATDNEALLVRHPFIRAMVKDSVANVLDYMLHP